MNQYKLRTIKQITNVVNENNIDNFLVDFRSFLQTRIGWKKLNMNGLIKIDFTSFNWMDDGKNDVVITINPLIIKKTKQCKQE